MNREEKLGKLTSLFGEMLGVWGISSVSELDVHLKSATDGQIIKLSTALYDEKFIPVEDAVAANSREKMIEKINEVYFKYSKPEGSA